MRKKLLALGLAMLSTTLLQADENADNEALLQALLDKGYLEIAHAFHKSAGADNLTAFARKLIELRFLEAEVAAGNTKKQKEVDALRSELVEEITPENVDAARLTVKFDYGVFLLKAGEHKEGIKHLEFFSRYYNKVNNATPNDDTKIKLTIMFYDVDLHLGRAHFNLAQATEDREARIESLDNAFEKIGDYIWSLQDSYPEHAIKGYPDLLEIVAANEKEENEEEPLSDVIDQILAEKPVPEGWGPIWRAKGNPDSLPHIFAAALKCLELQTSESDRQKLGMSLLKQLENKIKLDPEPTYYMTHQLNLELAKFCAYLAFDAGLSKKASKTFEKKGKAFIEKVPNDPSKSPYAGPSAIVAERFGLERGEVTQGDPLLEVALDHYHASRYDQARRGFENLLRNTAHGTQRQASLWFYIGLSYYKASRFLEANLAFEKSWATNPDWVEGKMSGAKAFDLHENSAKLFSKERKRAHPQRPKELLIADREFQQTVRKRVFTERPGTKEAVSALFFWSTNMRASDYIDDHLQLAYDGFAQIPGSSKFHTESLYNMFRCSFSQFQGMAKDDPQRKEMFDRASSNAKALFNKTEKLDPKDKGNQSLLKSDAAARTIVVQLYLLEPSKAGDAREILETLESKYGSFLSEAEIKRIPAWKIEARINMGTAPMIDEAMKIWEAWQKKVMAANKDKPTESLVKYTQKLANEGVKAWMSKNSGHAKAKDFAKHNTRISQWILKNVKFTPLLLVQLALTDKNNQQWAGVVENTNLFVKNYESDPTWKSDAEAKKYAPQMYAWQVEAYKKIDTEDAWVRVAECYEAYNKRKAHSMHRRRRADAVKTAGDRAAAKNKPSAKDHYVQAAGMYAKLRRAKGSHAPGTDFYWSSYEMTLQCRMALEEYDKLRKIMTSLRLSVTDSDKRREWLLTWIDKVIEVAGVNVSAPLQQLKKDIAQDHKEYLENIAKSADEDTVDSAENGDDSATEDTSDTNNESSDPADNDKSGSDDVNGSH